ncbi:MAG: nucleotide exchange factor GrpE [Candidatus Cloacimonetes bacterium]|nr:nucleotide exchange factor GrpE [Candidatus Cloacimonadota bacterium]
MSRKKKEIPVNQEALKARSEKNEIESAAEFAEETEDKSEGRIKELESKIIDLEKEKNDANDKYLRTLAEFENFRRRSAQERINWIKNANESLILKMCDVLDDFERAFENHPLLENSDNLYQGIGAIYRKLLSVMKSEGVAKIETDDMEFDPMYHDAVTYTPSDLEKDRIVSVIQNGYIMNNKVIRPAKVVLSSGELVPESITDPQSENNQEE